MISAGTSLLTSSRRCPPTHLSRHGCARERKGASSPTSGAARQARSTQRGARRPMRASSWSSLGVAGERLLKSSAVGPISKVRGTCLEESVEPQPAVSQRLVSLPGSPRQRTQPLDAAFMEQEPELAPACGDIGEATLPRGAFGWWRPPRAPRRPRVRPLGKHAPHSLSRPRRRLWRCAAGCSRRSGQVSHGRRRHGYRFEAL
jgi:hypothetical protein